MRDRESTPIVNILYTSTPNERLDLTIFGCKANTYLINAKYARGDKLYRCVPWNRVWFWRFSGLKYGIHFVPFLEL